MTKKQIFVWIIPFLSFGVGVALFISLECWLQNGRYAQEREAYEILNHVLQNKLKSDISYAQRCTDNAKKQIEDNWPSEATSFLVVIDDYFWGNHECRVFFDTGDVYYIETSHDVNKVTYFKKMKWPDYKAKPFGRNVIRLEHD